MQLYIGGDDEAGYAIFNSRGHAISRPFALVLDAIAEMNRLYPPPPAPEPAIYAAIKRFNRLPPYSAQQIRKVMHS